MTPDLYECDTEALAAAEADRRMVALARAGVPIRRHGSASVEMSDAFGGAVPYLLEVFATEIVDWTRSEGLAWGDWIVIPRQHRDVCVFSVVDPEDPERSREYAIKYELDRCVESGDWSVDGYAMARVDGRAMDELGVMV